MKLASFAAAAVLALAPFAPQPAAAGEVWSDGRYYSACPEYLDITISAEKNVVNGWTKDFSGGGWWRADFSGARVDPAQRVMFCDYHLLGGRYTMTQRYPSGYSSCSAYSGIWFRCDP